MELTERERRIIAELEGQFSSGGAASTPPRKLADPVRRSFRPQWTITPAAVLGCLLLAAGVALGVSTAVLQGVVLLAWWLSPWLPKLLRGAGRTLLDSAGNTGPYVPPITGL